MKSTLFRAAVAIALSTAAVGQAPPPPQKLAVPAFFEYRQCSDGGVNPDWVRIENAGQAVKIVVSDMTTLCAGYTGDTPAGPGTRTEFDKLRAPPYSQLVLGYVDTAFSCRTEDGVFNGGDRLRDGGDGGPCDGGLPSNPTSVNDWYKPDDAGGYAGHIDGIYFDDGSGAREDAGGPLWTYYNGLYQRLRQEHTGPCDGGRACVMLNAVQYPNDWVMSVADYVTTWERPLHGYPPDDAGTPDTQDYITRFCPDTAATADAGCATRQTPDGWYFDGGIAPRTHHVVFGIDGGDVNATIDRIVCKSQTRGSPMLFMNHRSTSKYGVLPDFFEQEVVALQGCPLVVVKSGSGGGTVTSSPGGINCGSACSWRTTLNPITLGLTATPDGNSRFVGFSGGGCASPPCASPLTLTMSEPTTVTAQFDLNPALTIVKSGSGSGTITSSPSGINCGSICTARFPNPTTVTLTATPYGDSLFDGFSGGCTSSSSTCQFTISQPTTVTAKFNVPTFQIIMVSDPVLGDIPVVVIF